MTTTELQDLTFTTKDEYLTWKAEWKQAYIKLSREIRKAKRLYRSRHRQFLRWEQDGIDPKTNRPKHRAIYSEGVDGFAAMCALHTLKADARYMLDVRAASKKKAGEQWRAARTA